MADIILGVVGFVLTLLVLSYVLGDNTVFRFAANLFVGVSAGYLAVVVCYQVIWIKMILPLLPLIDGTGGLESMLALIPLVLSVLLLTKLSARLTNLGKVPMAILVGIGAAVTIGGAVLGTIFPQMLATVDQFGGEANAYQATEPVIQVVEATILLVGVITTLLYFYFGAKSREDQPGERPGWLEGVAKVGKVFIAVTFGSLFSGVLIASLTALVERVSFLWSFLRNFF